MGWLFLAGLVMSLGLSLVVAQAFSHFCSQEDVRYSEQGAMEGSLTFVGCFLLLSGIALEFPYLLAAGSGVLLIPLYSFFKNWER